ncbi:hypothetical protein TorRG33x02_177240 [Trema orientale]|uniref:Protein CHUP1, chloroplastic n=1 Tax=Trema orientale TaxID=63057 RepID=A0A2P5ELU9_TREOI|nr:hypothetical protein TorRG33x02_177240 [Trema orientale]
MESEKVEEEEEEPADSNIPDEDKEAKMKSCKMLNNGTEAEILSALTREFEQRKVTLEWKLLQLYDLKEKKAYKAKLQRRLEEKSAEFDMLNATTASLQAEKMNLKEEIKQGFLVKKQLEKAKKVIAEMQKKIDVDARRIRGQVMMIEERVFGFQEDDTSERYALIEQKLKAGKDVELEVVKMKRINKELELEKRELAVKLVSTQGKIASRSHMTESRVMSEIGDEISTLRSGNEELSRQIEKLQIDRFDMVEELVYQRWLHSCLRFEIQSNDKPHRETSKNNLSKNPFMNSDDKTKPSISYHSSNSNVSSNSTSSTDSDQVESITFGSSSSSQYSTRTSFGLMQKFKNWGRRSKDDSSFASSAEKRRNSMKRTGLIRRFSTSMVPENSSMRRNKGESTLNNPFREKKEQEFTASSEKPSYPRVRRVSFSDLVKKDDMESSDIGRELNQKTDDESSSNNLSTDFESKGNSEEENSEMSLVNAEDSSDTSPEKASSKEESFDLLHVENKVENHMMSLFAAILLFLLFIFLAYCLQYKR